MNLAVNFSDGLLKDTQWEMLLEMSAFIVVYFGSILSAERRQHAADMQVQTNDVAPGFIRVKCKETNNSADIQRSTNISQRP
jgi:hypothetical protein